ncbi:DUF6056 family protein [Treponema endosymbiont of Eucomonympha sp.]|uniref:DUF6056 family protein n=2 Tax=Treponema endosymbiont of Eucomonympha sp. TaxID=1580831 RepID=UPI000A956FB8|nr:DUF6056 family protein [Treponema endosymbiont of Eucomonympha sp.]
MAVSPEFPTRASFTGVVFLCVALLSLARRLEVQGQIKQNFPALYAFALGAFLFSFACATKDIREIHVKWKQRAEYILAQKEKGVLDVEIREPIPTSVLLGNKYAARGNDITTDPGKWPNNSIADYFGIRSIRGVENSDEIW